MPQTNNQRVQEKQAWSNQRDFLGNRESLYLSYSGSITNSPSWKNFHSNINHHICSQLENWFAIIWPSQSDFLFKGKELLDRDDDDDDDDDDGDDDGDCDDGDGDDGDDGDLCMMWMSVPLIDR